MRMRPGMNGMGWTRRRWLATSAGLVGMAWVGAWAKEPKMTKQVSADVDVAVIGGGPAGLEAALMLGRGMKSAVVFDAGPPRNARATGIMGFVTRDGINPMEFRRIAKGELGKYGVRVEASRVMAVDGERGRFEVRHEGGVVIAKRVVLTVGMVDSPVPIAGAEPFWGHHIFQCPYCHGWEHRGLPWGVLASSIELVEHAPFFKNWSGPLTVFVAGLEVPGELADKVGKAGVKLERRPILRAVGDGARMVGLEVGDEGGRREIVPCEALIARPPQSQTALVRELGLELDEAGFVKVDGKRQTSRAGIFAAGDLCTAMQSAMGAAAAGQMVAAMVSVDLMS